MNLLESYKNRIAIAESIHKKNNNGAAMSTGKKVMLATVLNNTSKFLNEAFDNSPATQRTALGDYKRFCLNISTAALPNLILPEIMLTHPMTSLTGYVTYLRFTAGQTKGGVEVNEIFNSPYRLGDINPQNAENRANYTAAKVVETINQNGGLNFAWDAAVKGSVEVEVGNVWTKVPEDRLIVSNDKVTGIVDGYMAAGTRVRYIYDNVVIPQTKLPTLKADLASTTLTAKARRIAVYYSQIAAFQAKNDYGFDLGDQLSSQAQGELAYEIDTEGVLLLKNGAELVTGENGLVFDTYEVFTKKNATNGTYISRSQYYEGLGEILSRAKRVIYERTKKFSPNYMIIGTNVLTIMPYLKGWNAATVNEPNGAYYAGSVDGLKVYVSPAVDGDDMIFGVNGSDMRASAAVYAPYMAIVPTQLLGFADGSMSQGFSTMYDMKLLNTYVYKNGKMEDYFGDPAEGVYSYLLAAGKINSKAPTDPVVPEEG